MFDLKSETPPTWTNYILDHLDDFLLDHAACERKASASAMAFVVRYPDHPEIVETMIEVAQEELDHFAQLTEIIHQKGLQHSADQKDKYVNALIRLARSKGKERLLDRLLIFSIIEGRGCERFFLLAKALENINSPLADLYHDLVRSEARHHAVGIHLARQIFPETEWKERLDVLLTQEAKIVSELPITAALH